MIMQSMITTITSSTAIRRHIMTLQIYDLKFRSSAKSDMNA
jgi:hypothetical protein